LILGQRKRFAHLFADEAFAVDQVESEVCHRGETHEVRFDRNSFTGLPAFGLIDPKHSHELNAGEWGDFRNESVHIRTLSQFPKVIQPTSGVFLEERTAV